jgi:hypothetical protein
MISNLVTQELRGFKTLVEIQGLYLLSLPTRDWYGEKENTGSAYCRSDNGSGLLAKVKAWPEADNLKSATKNVAYLQAKMQSELRFAKCEFAWGKLGSKDMVRICRLLRNVLVPSLGIESLTEIAHRIENRGGWGSLGVSESGNTSTESESTLQIEIDREQWKQLLGQLNDRVKDLQQIMREGFDHALYTLELAKPPPSSTRSDLEANGRCSPGDRSFANYFEKKIQDIKSQREGCLKQCWARKGLDDPVRIGNAELSGGRSHVRHPSQLYLILDVSILTIPGALNF